MDTDASKLTPANVTARILRVPAGWLKSEAEAGRVPCLKAGNRILFDPAAVERVLLERARSLSLSHSTARNGNGGGDAT